MTSYLEVSREAGAAYFSRGITGAVVMLNLLKFRTVADYSSTPELEPDQPISGREAYDLYINLTLPHLREAGGDLVFLGTGGSFLIGPSHERWDVAMLVRHKSPEAFLAFASHEEYLGNVIEHRTAALEDSRLLPLIQDKNPHMN